MEVPPASPTSSPPRRRSPSIAALMIVGAIAAQRAANHVRTVDFLLLFVGGGAFGAGLAGAIRAWRERRARSVPPAGG